MVCALNNGVVGIDVEVIKPIDYHIVKRFFAEEEYKDLMHTDINERLEYFYKIWTLKESYIKEIGKGLSISLNSFSFKINDENINMQLNNEVHDFSFWQVKIDEKQLFL